MAARRVVVTGLGALTPVGNTAEELWSALKQARSGIGPITKFDTSEKDAQGEKGMQLYSDMRKRMKVSRIAVFRPGAITPDKKPVVSELRCIVKWMSSISNQERKLEYSKVIVRPAP